MSYDSELAFAADLANSAGEIMLRYFKSDDIGVTLKPDQTHLTVADTTINTMVIERVKSAFPDDGVIGEEESFEPDRNRVWVVDPIDGTTAFAKGEPLSAFSLGLVDRRKGQPLAAVVYDPYEDDLYTSMKGQGAWLNGKRLSVAHAETLKDAKVAAWSSISPHQTFDLGKCVASLEKQGATNFAVPSFVRMACKVATGEFAGAFMAFGSPWDSAAVALIVQEAGGLATDLDGRPRRYDEFAKGIMVSANQPIRDKLVAAVEDAKL